MKTPQEMPPDIAPCVRALAKAAKMRPTLAIILGSGFQQAISKMNVTHELPYSKIPGFPPIGVSGHAGRLLFGQISGVNVAVLSGRAHYYEGHLMSLITFPVRALAELGIRDILLTNAAGGLRLSFRPGDFMLINDHINFMGTNPLRGVPPEGAPRFVDMTRTYDPELGGHLAKSARQSGIKMHRGVYMAVSGPSYETPAEIRAFARLGADAVGMSTVPEALAARQCGLRVAAVSCITNLGAGLGGETLSHQEVLETAGKVRESAARLLCGFCENYGKKS